MSSGTSGSGRCAEVLPFPVQIFTWVESKAVRLHLEGVVPDLPVSRHFQHPASRLQLNKTTYRYSQAKPPCWATVWGTLKTAEIFLYTKISQRLFRL